MIVYLWLYKGVYFLLNTFFFFPIEYISVFKIFFVFYISIDDICLNVISKLSKS